MDVQQCKMFMTFKSQSDDIYALKLLSIILGETPVSRFFRVIREQQSLCYYCSCFYDEMKNLLVADCGIEKADSETIFREINAQIEDIGVGNISNEELESALNLLSSSLENVGDSTGSWINWYFQCICHESIYSPEDELKDYRLVTKARLVQAARSLKLDSVFTLTGKEASLNEKN